MSSSSLSYSNPVRSLNKVIGMGNYFFLKASWEIIILRKP